MEDYRQVVDALPGLNNRVAASFGVTVGELKELISSGKLTSEVFKGPLLQALAQYDGAAASRADNIEQTFNRTRTAYLEAIAAFETPISGVATSGANTLAAIFEVIENNATLVASAIAGVGVAAAAALGAKAISAVTAYSGAVAQAAARATTLEAIQRGALGTRNIETSARLISAQAAARSAAATLAEAEATAAGLPVRQRSAFIAGELAAARAAATTATTALTAAETAAILATGRLTAAQAAAARASLALGLAQRAGAGALALIGGPAGAALIAGAGLVYLATRQTDAEKSAKSLEKAYRELNEAIRTNQSVSVGAAEATAEATKRQIDVLNADLVELQSKLASGELDNRQANNVRRGIQNVKKSIEELETELDQYTDTLQGVKQAELLLANDEFLANYFREQAEAVKVSADEFQKAYNAIFPKEATIAKLKEQLAIIEQAMKQGLSGADQSTLDRASAAVKQRIAEIEAVGGARDDDARNAEEYAQRVKAALDEALPDRARMEEQVAQLRLLDAEYKKGGENAELYGRAIAQLEEKFRLENIDAAAEKIRKFTDVISARVDDPFESYRSDIALLNQALTELPDKASQIQLALANLDLSVTSELTVVESSGNREVLARSYQSQLEALNEFHQVRNVSEERAQENILALAKDYAAKMSAVYDAQFEKINQFNDAFSRQPDQQGVNLQVSFDGAKAEAAAIQDAQQRSDALASIAQTYQDRVTEIVRAGEATRAQLEQASTADRVAGFINANRVQIDAATNLVDSILSLRANREKAEADQALATARNLEKEAQDARKVYEQSGLETDRLLADQATARAKAAEVRAKRDFEQQKKAQLQQARLSQLLAIMNAYATGGNWLTGLAFAATAGIATQQVIDNIKAQQFNGGSDTISTAPGGAAQNYTITANQQPAAQTGAPAQERLVIVAGNFQSEDEAMFEAGRRQRQLYEQGYINSRPDGSLDFRNIPDRVVRLS